MKHRLVCCSSECNSGFLYLFNHGGVPGPDDPAVLVGHDLARGFKVVDDAAECLIHHLLRQCFPKFSFPGVVHVLCSLLDHEDGIERRGMEYLGHFASSYYISLYNSYI